MVRQRRGDDFPSKWKGKEVTEQEKRREEAWFRGREGEIGEKGRAAGDFQGRVID
jgi:hypothetical protein